jgi:hypothetical protein
MKQTTYMNGRPRSNHFRAVQTLARNYRIDPRTGKVFNSDGVEVGSSVYEPRISVRFAGKKYGLRTHKAVAFVKFGPEALRRGVSVRHKDGDITNNKGSNLTLVYNREAAKALRRRLKEQAQLA